MTPPLLQNHEKYGVSVPIAEDEGAELDDAVEREESSAQKRYGITSFVVSPPPCVILVVFRTL
jgi:hypothetical protein